MGDFRVGEDVLKIQGKGECCGTVNVKFIKISHYIQRTPRISIKAAGHF